MKIKLSLIFFVLSFLTIFGQNNEVYESWSKVGVEYELNDFVNLNFSGDLRLKSIGNSYKKSFFQLESDFKIQKKLVFGLAYRNMDELDDEGGVQGHEKFNRYHANLRSGISLKKLSFRFRIQYQKKIQNKIDNALERNFWRLKLESEYNIKNWKYDPRIGFEMFLRDEINFGENYERYRLYFGTKFNLKKRKSFSIRYIIQKYLNNQNPTLHILRLSYNYEIKKKKKKKTIS